MPASLGVRSVGSRGNVGRRLGISVQPSLCSGPRIGDCRDRGDCRQPAPLLLKLMMGSHVLVASVWLIDRAQPGFSVSP